METPDLSKATITSGNCPEHGSNLYAIETGGIYCINGHMVGTGYGKGMKFDAADLYDVDDTAEVLNHESPESAIEYALENAWEKGKTVDQVLKEVCPLTVYAFSRKTIDKSFAASVVDCWVADFDETHWCEEYGNFEDASDPWSSEEEKSLRNELADVLQKYLDKAHVWQCDQVAKAEFSEAEIRELMPDYLKEL